MIARTRMTDGFDLLGITTPGLETHEMLGVSGAGVVECKTPTEFNQIWSVSNPTTTISAARGLQRCVGGMLKIKPIYSLRIISSS